MVTGVVIVTVLIAISLFPFPLGCAVVENVADGSHWDRVCSEIDLWYDGVILAAVTSASGGAVLARRANRLNRFVWGILVSLVLGAAPWVLLGDPAGNFGGVINLGP